MPTKAIDYSKTVIYKIVCNDLNITELYVGSTRDITTRKHCHKSRCNNTSNKHYHLKIYQTIRANCGWSNWSMVVIETFPCNNGEEARTRERYWYETLNAGLNMVRPSITTDEIKQDKRQSYERSMTLNPDYHKQYYQKIREHKLEYRLNYYVNHKAEIAEKRGILETCCCGSTFCHMGKARHLKTLKHLNYIAKQNPVVST